MPLQTEYAFTLPMGFEQDGSRYRRGLMRLATAGDEILPQKDPRVQNNPSYLAIVLLSRVIKLESFTSGKNGDFGVEPEVIERLFVQDLAYLQELYRRINNGEPLSMKTNCPGCKENVEVSISPGESYTNRPSEIHYKFALPCGYVEDSKLHKEGVMRLATAADEILPQKDPRVQSNPAYLTVIVLSRLVTKLGSLSEVNPRIIEGLFVQDLTYLQEMYRRINGGEELALKTKCPHCEAIVEVMIRPGES